MIGRGGDDDATGVARERALIRVGGLDHRVVVDGPRPDPNGACRQPLMAGHWQPLTASGSQRPAIAASPADR
jgi:hypothetical protein